MVSITVIFMTIDFNQSVNRLNAAGISPTAADIFYIIDKKNGVFCVNY